MEGDCLSCMKYLMFIFNFFIFVSSFYFESLHPDRREPLQTVCAP